jgi:hypothetical protein
VHDNNVQMLNATGPALGLAAGGASFKYAVAVCPWFNPLCVRLTTPTLCDRPGFSYTAIPGPFTYNSAAPGIVSSGGLGGPVLIPDLNGTTLPLTYNQANLAANGANSVLLLHTHNGAATTADVIVIIDGVFKDSFED